MNLDPKTLAELRASWQAVEKNAAQAAEQIKPHAQAFARSLDALKPELLRIHRRAVDETAALRGVPYKPYAGLVAASGALRPTPALTQAKRAQGGRE